MESFTAVLSPILFLAISIAVGFVVEKTRLVPNLGKSISKLITSVSLPALVIVSLSDQDVTQVPLGEMGTVLGVGLCAIVLLLAVNYRVGKRLKVPPERTLIHAYLGAFGNVIFLAYPLISAVLGARGLFYAILFSMANDLVLWSAGVYFLNRHAQGGDAKLELKYLMNPNTVGYLIGLALFALRLPLPEILHAPLARLGETTVPLSMLFIGSVLAGTKLKDALKSVSIWSLCVIKMVLVPLLFLGILWILGIPQRGVAPVMLTVIALQIAMPPQTSLSVIADRYRSDSAYAAQVIFISTLLSAGTLPGIYMLCSWLFR
ncbi:MAG: AEC family transporter [Oscillospiraceae bacterium]|nr:AEC family transporter [Oscillospiraceae bacterium]